MVPKTQTDCQSGLPNARKNHHDGKAKEYSAEFKAKVTIGVVFGRKR